MKKTITAYVYDSNFTGMPKEDYLKLTHLNYSFALIKEGKADISHWVNKHLLIDLQKNADNLCVCVSLGGWSADGFSQSVATEQGRELLADSCVKIIEENNFKGIDLDWEYPTSSIADIASSVDDAEKYQLFINLLKCKLVCLTEKTNIDYRITMAVGAMQDCVDTLCYDKIAHAVDLINVMTYDLAPWGIDKPTTHHTSLFHSDEHVISGDTAIQAYLKSGVPKEKLVLGGAFYGRMHTGVERGLTNGLGQSHTSEFPNGIRYSEIKERLSKTAERYWDDFAKAAYIYDQVDGLFASYDDSESFKHKAEYIYKHELNGIMFWEYGHLCSGQQLEDLFNAMSNVTSDATIVL